jgi:putative Ca2+/H+ antiporter (TMEM165/GDT1 family)
VKQTSHQNILGVIYLKNRFTELYLFSLLIITIGFFEIIFNYHKTNNTQGFYFGIMKLLIGVCFLVFSIASHIKYNTNRKQLEKEMSKEYDERDDLIEGKASHFTMRIIMIVIFLMMFLSEWVMIPINTALFIIIIFCMITNTLAKKYYNYFL